MNSFYQWVQESNLSENDLEIIKSELGKKALLWFALTLIPGAAIITYPVFMATWAQYKWVKQRTLDARPGLFWTICFVFVLLPLFLIIIPAIIFFSVKKRGLPAVADKLYQQGLIGKGR